MLSLIHIFCVRPVVVSVSVYTNFNADGILVCNAVFALAVPHVPGVISVSYTHLDFVLRLRDSSAFLPELEFVAEENGLLIGHILLTRQPVLLSAGTLSAVSYTHLDVYKRQEEQ